MHHEEGIQHLTLGQLKPQLGFIKEERKGASLPPVEIGKWKRFAAQTYQIHQRVIFTAFYQQQLDLTPMLTLAVLV